jgi:hypothetical protein
MLVTLFSIYNSFLCYLFDRYFFCMYIHDFVSCDSRKNLYNNLAVILGVCIYTNISISMSLSVAISVAIHFLGIFHCKFIFLDHSSATVHFA